MSRVGQGEAALQVPPISNVVWRRRLGPVAAWAVHRRFGQSDLVAVLAEDGLSVEVMELLMMSFTAPVEKYAFGDSRLPVVAVVIVLVLGFQFSKQKNRKKKIDRKKIDECGVSKKALARRAGSNGVGKSACKK